MADEPRRSRARHGVDRSTWPAPRHEVRRQPGIRRLGLTNLRPSGSEAGSKPPAADDATEPRKAPSAARR